MIIRLIFFIYLIGLVSSYYVGPGVPIELSQDRDWLVHPETVTLQTRLLQVDATHLRFSNGLISRTFATVPNFVTVGFVNEITQFNYWRAPKPEAQFTLLDGTVVLVGAIRGTDANDALWFPEFYNLTVPTNSFIYRNHSTERAKARFSWKPQRWSELRNWPPAGLRLNIDYAAPPGMEQANGLMVRVVYEMYDGIPVLHKHIEITNTLTSDEECAVETDGEQLKVELNEPKPEIFQSKYDEHKADEHRHVHHHHTMAAHSHELSHEESEWKKQLARNQHTHSHKVYDEEGLWRLGTHGLPDGSAYVNRGFVKNGQFFTAVTVEFLACPEHACDKMMYVETDNMPRHVHWDERWAPYPLNTTMWGQDWAYGWDATDNELQGDAAFYVTMLSANYTMGPDIVLPPGSTWESFHVVEICHDSHDEERQDLARRRWMRTLAPQGTENPIYWHLTNQSNLINAIHETADAGFEMLILSFGSGFDPESTNSSYIQWIADAVKLAHSLNLLIGGYTLMQNPNIGFNFSTQVIDPVLGTPTGIACFATLAHKQYRDSLIAFVNATGVDMLETDGPYEGAPCGAHNHEFHRGVGDSQVAQDYYTQDFYRSMKVKDIYFTAPDPYWLNGGTNKEPLGYTDRWTWNPFEKHERLAIGRMYAYDGTSHFPASMIWQMFNYYDYQPLSQNLEYIDLALAQYLGNGVITCYRGSDLYDGPETLALFQYWTNFYKAHRVVLAGDVFHIRRPDGQHIDVQMHVRPVTWPFSLEYSSEIALGFMFNPRNVSVDSYSQRVNLYYAGAQPGDVVNLEWGTSPLNPWNPNGPTTAVVDESFSITVPLKQFPAWKYLYFIITPMNTSFSASSAAKETM